jgi:hypothetical protein
MVAVVTAVADISAAVMAEGMALAACISVAATALAACISAVVTTPVGDSPSHIHFLEGACTAAILLPVMAGGTSGRYETPLCDPEVSAAL